MQNLNLATKRDSDISFECIKFPDGQQELFVDETHVDANAEVVISSRFNSFMNLELIICATRSLRNLGVAKVSLNIPYLLGARSDRQFHNGGVSYLSQVVAPIINDIGFYRVYCLDVHSNVAPACIERMKVKSNVEFVTDILKSKSGYILVSPDAGAKEKMYNLAKTLKYSNDIIVCSKNREISTGRILSTEIGNVVDMKGKYDLFIVDDICDGGRTFVEIAKKLSVWAPKSLNLIVTHGIFSAGFEELSQYFTSIYCTNSVKDITGIQILHQTKVI